MLSFSPSEIEVGALAGDNLPDVFPDIPVLVQWHCAELTIEGGCALALDVHVDAGAVNAAVREPGGKASQKLSGRAAASESWGDVEILHFARASMPRRRVTCYVPHDLALGECDKRSAGTERALRVVLPIEVGRHARI